MKGIKVIAKRDSRMLERATKAATGVSSMRLRIDIAHIKKMSGETDEIAWVLGKEQVVDALKKEGGKMELIRKYVGALGRREKGVRLIKDSVSYRKK